MNLPGFTAERALAPRTARYASSPMPPAGALAGVVTPQISFKCIPWLGHPLYLQALLAVKAAKSAGKIRDEAHCKEIARAGGAVAAEFGVPGIISGTLGKCVCEAAF